jgi:hypothetical protein
MAGHGRLRVLFWECSWARPYIHDFPAGWNVGAVVISTSNTQIKPDRLRGCVNGQQLLYGMSWTIS